MRKRILWTAAICLLGWAACKGESEGGPPKRKPDELGREIGSTYLVMMGEVGERIAATTDAAALHPELDKLKEEFQKIVDAKIKEGFFVRNPGLLKKMWKCLESFILEKKGRNNRKK